MFCTFSCFFVINVVFSPSFEKHSTSIASRLLSKMGCTKGGLVKDGQGVIVPITPKLRSSRQYLSYDENSLRNKSSFTKTGRSYLLLVQVIRLSCRKGNLMLMVLLIRLKIGCS